MYNNSLKCLQTVACVVVNELYDNVSNSIEREVVYQMTQYCVVCMHIIVSVLVGVYVFIRVYFLIR